MATRVSTTVRLFDVRLGSNRFVLLAFAVAFAGVAGVHAATGHAHDAVRAGVQAAFSVLLSWAMSRELDPDEPRSAAAAALAGFLVFFAGPTNLGAVTALLFAVRIAGDTPGAPPTPIDLIWLPGVAAYAARAAGGFPAAVALAAALAWDGARRRRLAEILSAAAALVALLVMGLLRHTLTPGWAPAKWWDWVILAGAAISVVRLPFGPPAAAGDVSGERLSPRRMAVARGLALAAGTLTVLWLGGPAAPGLVGLWSGLIGIGLVRSFVRGAGGSARRRR